MVRRQILSRAAAVRESSKISENTLHLQMPSVDKPDDNLPSSVDYADKSRYGLSGDVFTGNRFKDGAVPASQGNRQDLFRLFQHSNVTRNL